MISTGTSVDSTAPRLIAISIKSDNINPTMATVGNTISLASTASEPLEAATVTIAGRVAELEWVGNGGPGRGTGFTATIVARDSDTEGVVSFVVTYTDVSNNAGLLTSVSTDGSSVVIDTVPPMLSVDSATTDNAYGPTVAVDTDVATVVLISSEALQIDAKVMVSSTPAQLVFISAFSVSASVAINKNTPAGPASILANVSDLAGNIGSLSLNDVGLLIKLQPPTVETTIVSSNANEHLARADDTLTLTLISSDFLGQLEATVLGARASTQRIGASHLVEHVVQSFEPNGIVTFVVTFADLYGNQGSNVITSSDGSQVIVDNLSPTVLVISVDSSNIVPNRLALGDTVTVAFGVSEKLLIEPIVLIGGQTAIVKSGIDDGYNAQCTIEAIPAMVDDEGIEISIEVFDLAGNNRTVTQLHTAFLVDLTPPTLADISLISDNCDTNTRVYVGVECITKDHATAGDTVLLSFIASESLGALPSVTLFGHEAQTIDLGQNAYLVMASVDATGVEGAVPFTIDYIDSVGNPGVTASATTDLSTVVVDMTAPRLVIVSITSSGELPESASPGDVVTLKIIGTEEIVVDTVTMLGGVVTAVRGDQGLAYTATHTVTSADPRGVAEFDVYYTDVAGNPGEFMTCERIWSLILC
jgi:hypothetical protein